MAGKPVLGTAALVASLSIVALGCVKDNKETSTKHGDESGSAARVEGQADWQDGNFLELTGEASQLSLTASAKPAAVVEFPSIVNDFVASFGAPKALCTAQKRAKIVASKTASDKSVSIDCSVVLNSNESITKDIIIAGEESSGVSIDCRGASIGTEKDGNLPIFIQSVQRADKSWSHPKDVVLKNCKIYGQVRIFGMAQNGQGDKLKESSVSLGHTDRAREAAPTHILLRNNVFVTKQPIPVYISPGTTRVGLVSSKLLGANESVALYLDAESGFNIFFGNVFSVNSSRREQVAIDSSSNNYFANNRLSNTDTGGMYLYRNCGEGGTVRHQTPSHNIIINNVFYYNTYDGSLPSVWAGSRNGSRSFCGEDSANQMGSGASDLDYAMFNTISGNQIYKLSPAQMIQYGSQPNFAAQNVTVSNAITRMPGCVVYGQNGTTYIPYGEKVGGKVCNGQVVPMENTGDVRVPFSCSISDNSNGCAKTATCPSGKSIVAARAACHLEGPTLPSNESATLNWYEMRVSRASEKVFLQSRGTCWLNNVEIDVGSTSTIPVAGTRSVNFGCRERDENGGDCTIVGELLCR